MTLRDHPLQRWPRSHRRVALLAAIVLAVAPALAALIVKPLQEGDAGGESIVDFEFAGSVERAEEILATWRAQGVIDEAKAIQIFDLLYPLIYGMALAGACVAAAEAWRRAGRPAVAAAGLAAAWLAFMAAGFDYVENLGLGVSLWGEPASPWPQIALVAAIAKTAGIVASVVYALSGSLARFSARRVTE